MSSAPRGTSNTEFGGPEEFAHRGEPEHCCRDPNLAASLTGRKIAVDFHPEADTNIPVQTYVGTVVEHDATIPGYAPRFLHKVKFADNDTAFYTFEEVILYHQKYINSFSSSPTPSPPMSLSHAPVPIPSPFPLPGSSPHPSASHDTPTAAPDLPQPCPHAAPAPVTVSPLPSPPVPASNSTRPLMLPNPSSFVPDTVITVAHPVSKTKVKCRIVERVARWDRSLT